MREEERPRQVYRPASAPPILRDGLAHRGGGAQGDLSKVLNVSVNEGRVLIDGPGVALTLDVEAESALSDQLLAGCTLARQQQRAAIGQAPHSGASSLG